VGLTRHAIYVLRNIEARSYNHCCRGRAIRMKIFWERFCSLRYPACNDHAPYCHLWPAGRHDIFPHYLI